MPATEMSLHGLLIAPASVQLPSVRFLSVWATWPPRPSRRQSRPFRARWTYARFATERPVLVSGVVGGFKSRSFSRPFQPLVP